MYDEFLKHRIYVAQQHNVKQSNVKIDADHPSGDIVIYVNGVFVGYVDEHLEFEVSDYFDNQ